MKNNNLIIDTLLNHIKSGKKPIILVKQLNISPQLLSYHLKELQRKGIIKKLTKGVWEIVKDNLELTSKVKTIRGHGFIWIIKLPQEIKGWNKRVEILTKNNINFLKKGNTIRIIIKDKKVWLNNNSIIIYEPKSFYATLPLETRKLAVYELLETIKSIESTLRMNLHGFKFKTKREHYALVKNDIAIQVNKDGERLYLTDNGEWWGVIDKSNNGDEFEFFKTPSYSGLVNSSGALGYYNSHKDTNWQVTPKFILNGFNEINKDREEFRKEIKEFAVALNKHIPAYEGMGNYTKKLGNEIHLLKQEIKGLKNPFKTMEKNYKKKINGNQSILDKYFK